MWYLHFVGVSGFFITTTINLHISFNTNTFYIWLFCNFDLSNINTSPLLRLENSKSNWKFHFYCIRSCLLATKHIIVLFSCPKITQLPILLNWFVCFSLFYRHSILAFAQNGKQTVHKRISWLVNHSNYTLIMRETA